MTGAKKKAEDGTASFSEFARRLNLKPSYVTELRKAGRLVLTEDGKRVRVDESRALIEATRDPSRAGVAARHAATRAAAQAPAATEPAADAGEPGDDRDDPPPPPESPYHQHRAETERWRAAAAKRDFAQSIGKLRDAAQVEAACAAIGVECRRVLERLPDELSPELAAITDEVAVRTRLREAVHHALHELGRDLDRAAKAGGA